jgi:hypothetical protein
VLPAEPKIVMRDGRKTRRTSMRMATPRAVRMRGERMIRSLGSRYADWKIQTGFVGHRAAVG